MVLTCHFFWSFCKLDAELTEKKCLQWCAFYHPRIKPVLQQMGFLQVAKSCCKKKRVVALFVTKTCSAFYCPKANVTILPRMASLPSNFIQSEDGIHPTPDLLRDRFTQNIAFQLVGTSIAEQVFRFCRSFYRSFRRTELYDWHHTLLLFLTIFFSPLKNFLTF